MLLQGFLSDLSLIFVEIMYYMPGFSDGHLALYLSVYGCLPGMTPFFCVAMDQTLRRCLKVLPRKDGRVEPTVALVTTIANFAGRGKTTDRARAINNQTIMIVTSPVPLAEIPTRKTRVAFK